jgi:hypothetical protein
MTTHLDLLWQLPAVFTAVPLVHRLLPFKLAARAIPLFYAIVSLVVMAMPDRVDLALAAAGLISLIHNRMGLRLSEDPPPDMKQVREAVSNAGALAWDYIVSYLQKARTAGSSQEPIVHDKPDDDNSEHEEFPDPPKPPEGKVTQRIPRL